MNGITHKQAKRHMRADLDGLLDAHQRLDLQTHLRECDACRAESESLASLTARLQSEFHHRWDKQNGPSTNVMANVHSQTRRIMLTRRINTGLRAVGGVAALLVLMLAINSIISQVKNITVATTGTQNTESGTPVFSSQTDNRLIAFTKEVDGNYDIYTMRADGSGLTRLTNSPAYDGNPFWSPDGKRIAFVSRDAGSFGQIYLMDADGSDVVQLTHDQANHEFSLNYGNSSGPWSPDGNKLIFTEQGSGKDQWMLYTVDIDGKNKTLLTEAPDIYSVPSWSPDSEHIAYIVLEPQENLPENRELFRIYVVDANGNNLTNITKLLPMDEDIGDQNYFWSSDGKSIFFIADRYAWENNSKSTFYEASLDGTSLVEIDHAGTHILDQWNGTSLILPLVSSQPLRWLRSDGTNTVLNPYKHCESSYIQYGPRFKRASNGDSIIGAGCANNDWWLYWANPDGTIIQQLLNSPISFEDGSIEFMAWSPDDQFIAFNRVSSDQSELYILNVTEAIKDPSTQPVRVPVSDSELYSIPSWQPILNIEVVEEKPTPDPTQTNVESNDFPPIGTGKGNGEWIAFLPFHNEIYSPEDMKMDVHMIHPDGTGLANLTNSPANYFWLEWSPNGNDLLFLRSSDTAGSIDILRKIEPIGFEVLVDTGMSRDAPFLYRWSPNSDQIAYIDNLAGNSDIYTIYADGRNDTQLKQLTNDPGQEIDFAWSPDGSQIAYQRTDGEELSIMVMDADGSNQHEVASGKGDVRLYWSVNGNSIYVSSTKNNWLECDGCVEAPAIYQIDLDGPSVQQIYYEPEFRQAFWYLYDTPQNSLYFMRIDPPHFMELWGTWFRADGNSVTEIGQLDPQQTCNAASGNVLNESISPNPRFSVISNFCAGGFDLYLADREAIPEKRFNHLLHLPLDTAGQGGDFATLPMTWSSDGRWIAYDNGNAAIDLLNIDGTLQDLVTEPLEVWQSENDFSTILEIAWQPTP